MNIQADETLPPHTDAVELANDMGGYFVRKVTAARSKLEASIQAPPSAVQKSDSTTTLEMTTDPSFSEFALLAKDDVKSLKLACKKSSHLDPLPSSILSGLVGSLQSGKMSWYIHCLIEKPGLELVNKNFRSTINLQFSSNLTKKAVAIQLQTHMLKNGLFAETQIAYREHHSTETALLKVKNDVLMNMDVDHVTLLVLLNVSAPFDTMDPSFFIDIFQ